ncbi:MAG: hypothetical protein F6J93_12225 [Oscillatoria sp. SIO1A7]|nr:hypothetical protein [Oscillatoria sp. SIO1A7]
MKTKYVSGMLSPLRPLDTSKMPNLKNIPLKAAPMPPAPLLQCPMRTCPMPNANMPNGQVWRPMGRCGAQFPNSQFPKFIQLSA